MRLFVAVELAEDVKEAIDSLVMRLQTRLDKTGARIRWVRKTHFHLTLKFLGEAEEHQVGALGDAIQQALRDEAPFQTCLEGLGCFPPAGPPRILWLGLPKSEAALASIAEKIETACHALGFSKEKRLFSAHLTLGRIKQPGERDRLRNDLADFLMTPIGPTRVESVSLMESHLTPDGSDYRTLKTIRFKGSPSK